MKFLSKQRPCWNASLVSNVSDTTQQKCDLLSRGNYLLFTLLLGTINLSLRIKLGGGLFYMVNNAMCSCTIPPLGPRAGTCCSGWHHSWLAVNVLLFYLEWGRKTNLSSRNFHCGILHSRWCKGFIRELQLWDYLNTLGLEWNLFRSLYYWKYFQGFVIH